MTAEAALLTALAALITSLITTVTTFMRLRREREQWQTELAIQKERWHKEFASTFTQREMEFIKAKVERRFQVYPSVFEVLGKVRDVPDPKGEHYQSLEENRTDLLSVAENLLGHLYGEAGLLMEYDTRNALLEAWKACHLFVDDKVTLRQLVGYFYLARRWVRADLQMEDIEGVRGSLVQIREKYNLKEIK
jgi:hypothetical protein